MSKKRVHKDKKFFCWACQCDLNEGDEYYVVTIGNKGISPRGLEKTRIVPLCVDCFQIWNKGRR